MSVYGRMVEAHSLRLDDFLREHQLGTPLSVECRPAFRLRDGKLFPQRRSLGGLTSHRGGFPRSAVSFFLPDPKVAAKHGYTATPPGIRTVLRHGPASPHDRVRVRAHF